MKYQLVIRIQEILNNFNTNNILEFLFSIYMCVFTCMHIDTGVHVHECTRVQGDHRMKLNIFLSCFSPYFLRQFPTDPAAHQPSQMAGLKTAFLCLPSTVTTGLRGCSWLLCLDSGKSNPRPHTCIARNLKLDPPKSP